MNIQTFDKISLDETQVPIIIEFLAQFYPIFKDFNKNEYIELINQLYEIIKNEKDKDDYQIIIPLKICFVLIKYCEEKKYYIESKETFEQIKDDIKKRLPNFNEIHKIKEIQIRIISELIDLKIFKKYYIVVENIIKIFYIPYYKFDNIYKKLQLQSKCIDEYFIKSDNDIIIKNINFYFLFLKYIKKADDINDIPHLEETKNVFLKNRESIDISDVKVQYIILQLFSGDEINKYFPMLVPKSEEKFDEIQEKSNNRKYSDNEKINNDYKNYILNDNNENDKKLTNIEEKDTPIHQSNLETKEETDTIEKKDLNSNNINNWLNDVFSKNLLVEKSDKIKVIEYKQTIEDKNNSNGLFKNIKNGYYIGLGEDNNLNACKKEIINYNDDINKKENIDDIIDYFEINNNEENCKIIAYGKKQIILKNINFEQLKIFENNNNINYLIKGLNEIFNLIYISSYYKYEILYFNGIQLKKDLIVLTISSELIPPYNKIIFYNIKVKQIIEAIEDYSLSINTKNLELIPVKDINSQLLLCGCKKNDDNKNGILLINIQSGNNIIINHYFQETKDLEIYCFCPILLDNQTFEEYRQVLVTKNYEKNNFYANEDDYIYKSNEYFLAGAYDIMKDKNMIELFQIRNSGNKNIEIIDLQEIVFSPEIDEFDKILNITQSEKSGGIFVNCPDGKVHLLRAPNIDYYLERDKKEKNN